MFLRFAVMAACVAACLAPTTALADANPNNHGNHFHYGWVNHHSPPPPAPNPTPNPAPNPGPPGGNTDGVSSDVAGPPAALSQAPAGVAPDLPVVQPPAVITTTVVAIPSVPDAWLVAILLGSALAAGVAAAVWLTGRGGHVALRRALAPMGVRI